MYGLQYLPKPHLVLHRKGDLGQYFASMTTNDGRTQYCVATFGGQDFDKTMCLALGNRSVQIIKVVAGQVERYPLRVCFSFVQTYCCQLWLGKVTRGRTR